MTDKITVTQAEAEIAAVVFNFIDRMNDVAPECGDPADRILDEFVKAVMPAVKALIEANRLAHQSAPDADDIPTIDLDKAFWEQICEAASQSPWIPKEYFANDWVSDICSFLRDPLPSPASADGASHIDGNEIWEILFGLLKGDVPESLTEDVLSGLASALNTAKQGDARHD